MRTIATAKVQRNYNCYNVYFNECLPFCYMLILCWRQLFPYQKENQGTSHILRNRSLIFILFALNHLKLFFLTYYFHFLMLSLGVPCILRMFSYLSYYSISRMMFQEDQHKQNNVPDDAHHSYK